MSEARTTPKPCAGLVVTWQGAGSGAYGSHRHARACEAHESQMGADDPWACQVYEGGRDDVACDYDPASAQEVTT